ncbi:hypothetical protein AKJ42_03105 [candidate division MSBL1 archaeon SCGC-AAA261C02]|uniref:Uncharacterized protein n=1 Tax=candidate division MSBL1 archaeon SCGC-AAA261C02 TaxID=1698272 RepID=A0A133UZ72_9EURY|nr:hypothetical protein AKJ42_03105 [candidate division MSBL1 archaeon SCGC-AAA261C02]
MIVRKANGRWWRAVIAQAREDILEWMVEIGYSFRDGLIRVIVRNNRNSDNYREEDKIMNLSGENIMMTGHVW